jgi:hypothetical protein
VRKLMASLASVTFGLAIAVTAAATASAAVQPATSHLVTKTANGEIHDYACTPPRTIEHPAVPIVSATNNCSTQVWLPASGSGPRYCISPGAVLTGSFSPASIAITAHTGACAASQAAAARPASTGGGVRPDVNSALLYYGSNHNSYACHYNTQYPARASGYDRIVNECSVRVWLKGPTGNWCSSRDSSESVPAVYSDPSTIQITSNSSSC